jgi:sporulation related protein
MEQTATESPPQAAQPEASCPHCGAPAEKDQLVCLRCGGRIALDYRRPPGWKLPTAIVASVGLVAAVAFGWALREITDNAESEVAKAPASKPAAPAEPTAAERSRQRLADRRERARAERRQAAEKRKGSTSRRRAAEARAERRRAAARRRSERSRQAGAVNLPGTWPTGKRGFTVILGSTDNPGSAKESAKQARQAGVPAGYLRSNDYSSLQKGAWLIYGGVYNSRGRAEKAAAKFGRGYPGAYVQLVNGDKAGKRKKA